MVINSFIQPASDRYCLNYGHKSAYKSFELSIFQARTWRMFINFDVAFKTVLKEKSKKDLKISCSYPHIEYTVPTARFQSNDFCFFALAF